MKWPEKKDKWCVFINDGLGRSKWDPGYIYGSFGPGKTGKAAAVRKAASLRKRHPKSHKITVRRCREYGKQGFMGLWS